MDFLNFVIALHEWLGVEIPEADYPQLVTLHQPGRPVRRSPLGTAGTIFLLESSGRRHRQ
jgi:hypothetical protein